MKSEKKPDGWAWEWIPPTTINGRPIADGNDNKNDSGKGDSETLPKQLPIKGEKNDE